MPQKTGRPPMRPKTPHKIKLRKASDTTSFLFIGDHSIITDTPIAEYIVKNEIEIFRNLTNPPHAWHCFHPELAPQQWENRFTPLADFIGNRLKPLNTRNPLSRYFPSNSDSNDLREINLLTGAKLKDRHKWLKDKPIILHEEGFIALTFDGKGKTKPHLTPESAWLDAVAIAIEKNRSEYAFLLNERLKARRLSERIAWRSQPRA